MSVLSTSRLCVLFGCGHSEVSSPWQTVNRFYHLLIVRRNKRSFTHDAAICSCNEVETQLQFDKRAIAVHSRAQGLKRGISCDKLFEAFENSARDQKLLWLQFVFKVNAAGHFVLSGAGNSAVH